jgi:hypothetical protein
VPAHGIEIAAPRNWCADCASQRPSRASAHHDMRVMRVVREAMIDERVG